ncbi:hypothetical protein [Mycobacterium sp. pW045]|uniref:hypothetical protein n=1 Tax=Mycobacterium sp. pW045 TaxID=3238984 RepID=UPI00351AF741
MTEIGSKRAKLDNVRRALPQPLFTTEQATAACLPCYVELFQQVKAEAHPKLATVIAEPHPE